MDKWIVNSEYTTREEEKYLKSIGKNLKDYVIPEIDDAEISVVRESNKHGIESYGWGCLEKIILF